MHIWDAHLRKIKDNVVWLFALLCLFLQINIHWVTLHCHHFLTETILHFHFIPNHLLSYYASFLKNRINPYSVQRIIVCDAAKCLLGVVLTCHWAVWSKHFLAGPEIIHSTVTPNMSTWTKQTWRLKYLNQDIAKVSPIALSNITVKGKMHIDILFIE